MYETSKISNFLTLMIMMIVVLTIYKSCIKNRQAAIRRNFNETYAQIILDGTDQPFSAPIFPPPPPSYSTVVENTSKTELDKEDDRNAVNMENNVSRYLNKIFLLSFFFQLFYLVVDEVDRHHRLIREQPLAYDILLNCGKVVFLYLSLNNWKYQASVLVMRKFNHIHFNFQIVFFLIKLKM